MAAGVSVIIPSHNPDPELLGRLYHSLVAQSHGDFEAIFVDDASDRPGYNVIDDSRFRVLYQPENRGPAACRNAGAAAAKHELLFFTDTDCELTLDALAQVVQHLPREEAIMGDTVTRVETCFGKAVAFLGFPGGGILGFDRVWRVDAEGYTNSFSSCNLAFRKAAFNALGRFNETFPVAGGEDTVLARHMADTGHAIRYNPAQIVYHVERKGLRSFIRWQIIRGRGNYHIKQHVPEVGGYLRLRLWTFRNSLREAGLRYALPVIILITISVWYQMRGFRIEKAKDRGKAPS